jgi:hypothetical protein
MTFSKVNNTTNVCCITLNEVTNSIASTNSFTFNTYLLALWSLVIPEVANSACELGTCGCGY